MFPEFGPGLGGAFEFGGEAEWGAVPEDGEHRTTGEVDSDTDDAGGCLREGGASGFGGRVEPIGGVLVGGLGGEGIGAVGEVVEDLTVGVFLLGESELFTIERDDNGADRFGAEVEAEGSGVH